MILLLKIHCSVFHSLKLTFNEEIFNFSFSVTVLLQKE